MRCVSWDPPEVGYTLSTPPAAAASHLGPALQPRRDLQALDHLGAGVQAELPVDPGQVELDRLRAQEERLGDLAVRQAALRPGARPAAPAASARRVSPRRSAAGGLRSRRARAGSARPIPRAPRASNTCHRLLELAHAPGDALPSSAGAHRTAGASAPRSNGISSLRSASDRSKRAGASASGATQGGAPRRERPRPSGRGTCATSASSLREPLRPPGLSRPRPDVGLHEILRSRTRPRRRRPSPGSPRASARAARSPALRGPAASSDSARWIRSRGSTYQPQPQRRAELDRPLRVLDAALVQAQPRLEPRERVEAVAEDRPAARIRRPSPPPPRRPRRRRRSGPSRASAKPVKRRSRGSTPSRPGAPRIGDHARCLLHGSPMNRRATSPPRRGARQALARRWRLRGRRRGSPRGPRSPRRRRRCHDVRDARHEGGERRLQRVGRVRRGASRRPASDCVREDRPPAGWRETRRQERRPLPARLTVPEQLARSSTRSAHASVGGRVKRAIRPCTASGRAAYGAVRDRARALRRRGLRACSSLPGQKGLLGSPGQDGRTRSTSSRRQRRRPRQERRSADGGSLAAAAASAGRGHRIGPDRRFRKMDGPDARPRATPLPARDLRAGGRLPPPCEAPPPERADAGRRHGPGRATRDPSRSAGSRSSNETSSSRSVAPSSRTASSSSSAAAARASRVGSGKPAGARSERLLDGLARDRD